ncbi:hypothetical protein DPMN_170250 [Dreissena polymorpha]|uniref:Selenoprotein P N-terminal domain-containing protein n=1 Tax=Dreissena polymorpha TaxID=45954 RepID=A0A9D4DZ40_DREPO|nr:hypothetical protein DPMN_170250 [Dreissena polymorpha]
MLQTKRGQLARQTITDIRFLIVNAADQRSVDNVGELARRVSFPVYQDTERAQIWSQLGGEKDDLLVYDRYGIQRDCVEILFLMERYFFSNIPVQNQYIVS